MGTCDTCVCGKKKGGKTNEILTPGSNMYTVNPYLYAVCRSICKISYPNGVGTGFFIKLFKNGKPLFLLMTNEHVITKNMIENKQTIDIIFIYDFNYSTIYIYIIISSNISFMSI